MAKDDLVLCAPVRTAIGTFGGSLATTPATKLGTAVLGESLRRAGLPAEAVDGVIMGNVVQAGTGMNPARKAAVAAGVPVSVPAMTVNRVCGSGLQAILSAGQEIRAGDAACLIAGGMENMDLAPYLLEGARTGYRLGDGTIVDAMLRDGLVDTFSGQHSGWHTEDLVQSYGIDRDAQDRWAARSQKRFAIAQSKGHFVQEIIAVDVTRGRERVSFAKDESNRPDTTEEILGRLKPAFRPDGTITAGNAPGLNSGAAAVVVCRRDFAEARGLQPTARIVAGAVAAVEPGMFGMGPVPAVRKALERAGWTLADVERVEINEAFAAIAIAVTRELGLDEAIVNPDGGAIAHGHPIGATGAVLVTRLVHALHRTGARRGLVALCIGGGQGIAAAVETID